MTRLVLAVAVASSLGRCGASNTLPTRQIRLGEVTLTVEVADTDASRAKGLMHRDHLPEDRGMLFVYPDAQPRSFWMKDTRIPLSIAFVDGSGKIVRIADMEPFSTQRTSSLYPARYAVEVNQGWFERHGVAEGTQVHDLP